MTRRELIRVFQAPGFKKKESLCQREHNLSGEFNSTFPRFVFVQSPDGQRTMSWSLFLKFTPIPLG